MMKTIIQSVKGTRDFYPEDMAIRSWLYQQIREVSESFGYQEWEGPILERIDLYAAKSGEELVKEQAFVFNDKGGDYIALRPELTPTLARMVAQRQNEMTFPMRWWAFGPFWRYERPQKGRTREFFQWNIDLVGANTTVVDAEIVAVAASFLKKVGLTSEQVKIRVNDRRLMDASLSKMGIPAELKMGVSRLIDRQDKMPLADWENYGVELGLSTEQIKELEALLNNRDLWQESVEMKRLFAILDGMGLSEYIQYDAHVIRGLDYYTGTVFEAHLVSGEGRAILGGGHYDNLVAAVGGDPLPAVGFAMGDVMITYCLKQLGLLPELLKTPAATLVTIFDDGQLENAYALAASLRRVGLKVVCYPEAVKLPKQLKYADRIGARFVIIEGPDEVVNGVVTLKDLLSRTQEIVKKDEVAARLKIYLA
jgi:histidyl-tRNA synthetase